MDDEKAWNLNQIVPACRETGKSGLGRRKNRIGDFMGAALPWILSGLFVAISCSFMGKKEK